ncbi:hypothetical protein QE391_004034 [Pseudomonas fluorescens]|nr:hypothetical protein [Pseudomonas fluorescens]
MSDRSRQVRTRSAWAGQVAPDDPHLMARALAAQGTAELIFVLRAVRGGSDLRAQLAGREGSVEFAGRHQRQQHQRVTNALFNDKLAGGGDAGKLRPALRRPVRQAVIVFKGGDGRTERLLGSADQRQENGGQFGKRGQGHGLSLIGV